MNRGIVLLQGPRRWGVLITLARPSTWKLPQARSCSPGHDFQFFSVCVCSELGVPCSVFRVSCFLVRGARLVVRGFRASVFRSGFGFQVSGLWFRVSCPVLGFCGFGFGVLSLEV
jgi:hypothetical protein